MKNRKSGHGVPSGLKEIMIKYILSIFLLVSSTCMAQTTLEQVGTKVGTVIAVHDGDTITVKVGVDKVTVRLAEIDAPELKQPFGPEAQKVVSSKVLNKSVIVKIVTVDKYKRTVGEVIYGKSTSLNKYLVRNGWAWWYKQYSKDNTYEMLQKNAQSKKLGLWKGATPEAPWVFRKKKNLDELGKPIPVRVWQYKSYKPMISPPYSPPYSPPLGYWHYRK